MKNYKSIFFLLPVFILMFFSCAKDQYYIFNDEARIQFGPPIVPRGTTVSEYQDTLKGATFYYDDQKVIKDTIYFDIYTIGKLATTARNYSIEQINLPNVDNAVPGKHYIAFDDPSLSNAYRIAGDSVHARVPIVILRDPELKQKTINLGFQLVINNNFKLGENSKLWRKLQITDRLSKPNNWSTSVTQYYLGTYSVRKHQFMIETTDDRWDDIFFTEVFSAIDLSSYYKSVLSSALIDYNNAHPGNPLKDENGELITFPN
ncbi:MAG: DUF4843 domain-containing protein [Sphingobacterium sp.]